MDRKHAVEVFRNMINEKGVVLPDETVLSSLLCLDDSAVYHFYDLFLTESPDSEVKASRSHFSESEWGNLMASDLKMLIFYGQYIESVRLACGFECAVNTVQNIGFTNFLQAPLQDLSRIVTSARSKATRAFCDLRHACEDSSSQRTEKLAALLKSRVTH
jgi:hypothetical protein